MFSDKAILNINGCVNKHNVRIWGSQYPHEIFQKQIGSPKVSVWTIFLTRTEYQLFYPQIDEFKNVSGIYEYFQQYGAPHQYKDCVQDALKEKFPDRWIGRG